MEAVHWWLARSAGQAATPGGRRCSASALLYLDWEMMTYWAIVGLSHALLYYRESRDRELRAAQLETRLVEAQLKTLQQQLHPHFLFNTLHAISALMHRDVEAADRMLMQLSDLLRITLEHLGQQEVTLDAELDFLSKYLEIEQTRFADRLVVRFDIQPETLDALRARACCCSRWSRTPSSTAWRGKSGPGHIDITARRDGDKLRLEVRDDGVGLSEDALTALQKGIGVSTTRARLQHLFGADYRFEFHRLPQGLAVIVACRGGRPAAQRRRPTDAADASRQPDRRASMVRRPAAAMAAASQRPEDPVMKKIKVLVVDDEPLARERLTSLLSQEPDIEVVGQARDGEEAVTAIHDDAPDLVFLDVQMPQMNGFEVIEAVGTDKMPLVIFVTAYDQHALKAFQVRALDYLLKPFDRERFTDALQRARKQIERDETGDLGRRLLALVKDLRRDQPRSDRLVVKSGGRLFFLRTDEIDWIEAAGNYVRLHVGPTSHLLRETMNAIEGAARSRRSSSASTGRASSTWSGSRKCSPG